MKDEVIKNFRTILSKGKSNKGYRVKICLAFSKKDESLGFYVDCVPLKRFRIIDKKRKRIG